MKTTRDIKSGLEVGRRRRTPSRTAFFEHKLRKEFEDEFIEVLSEEERAELEGKGMRWVDRHKRALRRSQLNILRAKEKANIMQEMRSGERTTVREEQSRAKRSGPKKEPEKKDYHEIDLEY